MAENKNIREGYISGPIDVIKLGKTNIEQDNNLLNKGYRTAQVDTGGHVINRDPNFDIALYQHYLGNKYGHMPNWSSNDLYQESADQQSTFQALTTLINPKAVTYKAGNRILRDLSKIPNLVNIWNGDYNFTNSLLRWTQRNERLFQDEGNTSLSKFPNKTVGDFKGFINLLSETETSGISVALETLAIGGVIGGAASALTKGLEASSKLATFITKGATFLTSFDLTATESVDQAIEAYNNVLLYKQKQINPITGLFYTKNESKNDAEKASKIAFWANQVIGTALNTIGLEEIIMPEMEGKKLIEKGLQAETTKLLEKEGLKEGVSQATKISEKIKGNIVENANKLMKDKFGLKRSLVTGVSEYFEEDMNDFATDLGTTYGETGKYKFGHNFITSIFSRQGLFSGLSGFIGGVGNHLVMGRVGFNLNPLLSNEQIVRDSDGRIMFKTKDIEDNDSYLNVPDGVLSKMKEKNNNNKNEDNAVKYNNNEKEIDNTSKEKGAINGSNEQNNKQNDKKENKEGKEGKEKKEIYTIKRPKKQKNENRKDYLKRLLKYENIKRKNVFESKRKQVRNSYLDTFDKKAELYEKTFSHIDNYLKLIDNELIKKSKNDETFSSVKLNEYRQRIFDELEYFHFYNNSEKNLKNTFEFITNMSPEKAKEAGLIDDLKDNSYKIKAKKVIDNLEELTKIKKQIYDKYTNNKNIISNLLGDNMFDYYLRKHNIKNILDNSRENVMIKLKEQGIDMQTAEILLDNYIKYGEVKRKGKKDISFLDYLKLQIDKDYILEQLHHTDENSTYGKILSEKLKKFTKLEYDKYNNNGKTPEERNKQLNELENSKEIADLINKHIDVIQDLAMLYQNEILANSFSETYNEIEKQDNIKKLKEEIEQKVANETKIIEEIKEITKKIKKSKDEKNQETIDENEKNKDNERKQILIDKEVNKEIKKQVEKEKFVASLIKGISILEDKINSLNIIPDNKNILLEKYKNLKILINSLENIDENEKEYKSILKQIDNDKTKLEKEIVILNNNINDNNNPTNKVNETIVDDKAEANEVNSKLSKNPIDNINQENINKFKSLLDLFTKSVDNNDSIDEDNAINYTLSDEEMANALLEFQKVMKSIYDEWSTKYKLKNEDKNSYKHYLEFYKFISKISNNSSLEVLKDLYNQSIATLMAKLKIFPETQATIFSKIIIANSNGDLPDINNNVDNEIYNNNETKPINTLTFDLIADSNYNGRKLEHPSVSIAYNERSSQRVDMNGKIHYVELKNITEGRITDLLKVGDKILLEIDDNDDIEMDRPDFISKSDKDKKSKITWGELKKQLKPEDIYRFIPIKIMYEDKLVGYLHNEWFIKKKGLHVAVTTDLENEISKLNKIRSSVTGIENNITNIKQQLQLEIDKYKQQRLGDTKGLLTKIVNLFQTINGKKFLNDLISKLKINSNNKITVYRVGNIYSGHFATTINEKIAKVLSKEKEKENLPSQITKIEVDKDEIKAVIDGIEGEVIVKLKDKNKIKELSKNNISLDILIKKLEKTIFIQKEGLKNKNLDKNLKNKIKEELTKNENKLETLKKRKQSETTIKEGDKIKLNTKTGGEGIILEDRNDKFLVEKTDGTKVQVKKENVSKIEKQSSIEVQHNNQTSTKLETKINKIGSGVLNREKDNIYKPLNKIIPDFSKKGIKLTIFRNGQLNTGPNSTFKGTIDNLNGIQQSKPEGSLMIIFPASNDTFIADLAKIPKLNDKTLKYDLADTVLQIVRDYINNKDRIIKNIADLKNVLSKLVYSKKFTFEDLDWGDKTNYRYFFNINNNGDIEFAHIDPELSSSWKIYRISLSNNGTLGQITVLQRDVSTGEVIGPYNIDSKSQNEVLNLLKSVVGNKYLNINLNDLDNNKSIDIPLVSNGILSNINFDNYQNFISNFIATDVLEKKVIDKDGNTLSKFTIQPTIEFDISNIKSNNNEVDNNKVDNTNTDTVNNTNSNLEINKQLLNKVGDIDLNEEDEFDDDEEYAISYSDDILNDIENQTITTKTGLNYIEENNLIEELLFNIDQKIGNNEIDKNSTIDDYFVAQKDMYIARKQLLDNIIKNYNKNKWDDNRKTDNNIKENYGKYRLLTYNQITNRLKTLSNLLDNYDYFKNQVTSKLFENINDAEDEIKEDEIKENEVKPKWDRLLNEDDIVEKASVKLKLIMRTIPICRFKLDEKGNKIIRNGKPVIIYSKNSLGGKEREDYRLIVQAAHSILVDYSSISAIEKFDMFIKKLKESNNAALYLFANKLENADDNTKASFITVMSVQDTNSVMIMFKSEKRDIYDKENDTVSKQLIRIVIPIYNSEKSQISNIIDKFYFNAQSNINQSSIMQKVDGKLLLNKTALNDYKEKILLKNVTLDDFYKFLNDIGIDFTKNEFNATVKNKELIQRLFKNKYGIFIPENFIVPNGIMNKMIDSILTLNDDTDLSVMSIFTNINRDFVKGFAKMKLTVAKRFGTSTFKNGEGNMVSSVSKNHMVSRTLHQLQQENSTQLEQLSNKNSVVTGIMNDGKYRSFWIQFLNGIDKNTMQIGIIDSMQKWSKYSNAKTRPNMSRNELMIHMLFSFLNGNKKVWSFMPLTYSDKKTSVYSAVPRYSLNFKTFVNNDGSINKLTLTKDNMLNLKYDIDYQESLWRLIILPEIKRINKHVNAIFDGKITKDDISSNEYYGGYLFYFLPELNNDSSIRDNIGRIIINSDTSKKLLDSANKAFDKNIKDMYNVFSKLFIEKNIKNESKIKLVATDFIKKNYQFGDIQKLTPEQIILMLATDFTINYRIGLAEYTKTLGSNFSSTYKAKSKDIFNDNYIITRNDVEALDNENKDSLTPYRITNNNKKSFIELIDNHSEHLYEKIKQAINEYTKRMAKDIAPRMDGYWTDKKGRNFSKFRQLYITEPPTDFYNKDYSDLGIMGYSKVEGADAQAYGTLFNYIVNAHAYANIDDDTYYKIMDIIDRNHKENKEIIETLENEDKKSHTEILKSLKPIIIPEELKNKLTLISLKPVYAASKFNNILGRKLTTYIKISEFPLTYEITGNTQIDLLRRQAEYLESKYGSPVSIAMLSGTKEGANNIRNIWNIDNENKSLTINADNVSELHGEELNRDGYGIQLEEPLNEVKTRINIVTQANKLLFAGLLKGFEKIEDDESMKGFIYNNKTYSASKLKTTKENIRKEIVKQAKNKLLNELGIIQNNKTGKLEFVNDENISKKKSRKKFIKKLHQIIIREMKNRNYTELDKDMVDTINDNDFKFPLDFIPKSSKIEALLLSIITNRIVKQKIPGKNYINVAGNGIMTFKHNSDFISDIIYTKNYNNERLNYVSFNKDNNTINYAQCFVPFNFTDEQGNLLNINDFVEEKNGKKYIDTNKIDKNLLKLIGMRIPNQGHSSILTLEIAGFLPSYMKNVIVLPPEITAQMGSDNDYDHLYTYSYNTNLSLEQEEYNSIKQNVKLLHTFDEYKGNKEYNDLKQQYINLTQKYNKTNIDRIKLQLNNKELDLFDKLLKDDSIYIFEKQPTLIKDKNDYRNTLKTKLSLFNKEWLQNKNKNKKEISNLKTDLYNIRNKEYKKYLSKEIQKAKKEHGILNKLEYDVDNLDNNNPTQLQNAYVDIFHSVLSNPKVAEKMLQTLDLPYLGDESDLLKKINQTNNDFDPLSPIYAIDSYLSNQAGKMGVAIQSLNSSFLAIIEDKNLLFKTELLSEFQIKVKNNSNKILEMIGSGKGHTKLLDKTKITNMLINMMFQSETVDNAKNQKLSPINYNTITAPIYNVLMGMIDKNNECIPMESLTRLMTQDVMNNFLHEMENKTDITGSYNNDKPSDIFINIFGKYKSKYQKLLKEKEGNEAYINNPLNIDEFVLDSPKKLLEYLNLSNDEKNKSLEYNKFQTELAMWLSVVYDMYVKPISNMITPISGIDSTSVGKNMLEMENKKVKIIDSIKNSPYSNAKTIFKVDNTNTELGEVYNDSYNLAHNLYMTNNLMDKYLFSQNSNRFNEVLKILEYNYNFNLDYIENKNKVWTMYKQYIFAEALKKVYDIDLQKERKRLLYGNDSLAMKTINYQKEKWFIDNDFLMQLKTELNGNTISSKNGKYINEGNNAMFEIFDSYRKDSFKDKLTANEFTKIFLQTQRDVNNNPNNTDLQNKLDYLEDIIKYTILEGGVQNAHNWTKYIQSEVLEKIGLLHYIRNSQIKNIEISEQIANQIARNDPKLVHSISLSNDFNNIPNILKIRKNNKNKIIGITINRSNLIKQLNTSYDNDLEQYSTLIDGINMFKLYDRNTKQMYLFELTTENTDGYIRFNRINPLGSITNKFNELGTNVFNSVFDEEIDDNFKSKEKILSSDEVIIPTNNIKDSMNYNKFKESPSVNTVFDIINKMAEKDDENGAVAKIISMFPELYEKLIVYNKVLSVRAKVKYDKNTPNLSELNIDINRLELIHKNDTKAIEKEFNELLLHELLHPIFKQLLFKIKNNTANESEKNIYNNLNDLKGYLMNEQIKKYPELYKQYINRLNNDESLTKEMVEKFHAFSSVEEMLSMGWTNSNVIEQMKNIKYNKKTALEILSDILSKFINNIANIFGIKPKENAYYNFIESSLNMYLTLAETVEVKEKKEIKPTKIVTKQNSQKVKANIPQNLISGKEMYGTKQEANIVVKKLLGSNPHSIDMIEKKIRTRTTRSVSEMNKYNIKVGDIVNQFGKSSDGNTKNILTKITAIYGKEDKRFLNNWYKEGWTENGKKNIERFRNGVKAIEFEVINITKQKETPINTSLTQENINGIKLLEPYKIVNEMLGFKVIYSNNKIYDINTGTDITSNFDDVNIEEMKQQFEKQKEEYIINNKERDINSLIDKKENKVFKPKSSYIIDGGFTSNKQQTEAINKAVEFLLNQKIKSNEWFVLEGKAGTGKTTIISTIINEWGKTKENTNGIIAAALSNKAKQVIAIKTSKIKNLETMTIAKLLGMSMNEETGEFIKDYDNKFIPAPIEDAKLIIIDEASMVNEETLNLILQTKQPDTKIIFIGDIGQLPPIRKNDDPLNNKDSPVFKSIYNTQLTERVRQGEDSSILPYADYYWNNSRNKQPLLDPTPANTKNTNELKFLNKTKSINIALDLFKIAIKEKNPNKIKIIAYRNNTRKAINEYIHTKLFGNENEYNKGEMIMFYKKGWQINKNDKFDNSEELSISNVVKRKFIINQLGKKFILLGYNITLPYFDTINQKDMNVDIPVLNKESKILYDKIISEMFNQAAKTIVGSSKRKELYKKAWEAKDKFANIDYSYVITSHKSQGSTYETVVIYKDDILDTYGPNNKSKSQSLYTALTRASKLAIVIDNNNNNVQIDNAIDYNITNTNLGFSEEEIKQGEDLINKCK